MLLSNSIMNSRKFWIYPVYHRHMDAVLSFLLWNSFQHLTNTCTHRLWLLHPTPFALFWSYPFMFPFHFISPNVFLEVLLSFLFFSFFFFCCNIENIIHLWISCCAVMRAEGKRLNVKAQHFVDCVPNKNDVDQLTLNLRDVSARDTVWRLTFQLGHGNNRDRTHSTFAKSPRSHPFPTNLLNCMVRHGRNVACTQIQHS